MDNLFILLTALVIYFVFVKGNLFEGFEVVKHGIAVTEHPPQLPKKPVPWADNYNKHSRSVHDIYHEHVLTNAFPMLKPPSLVEETIGGERVDVARSQFVPKMAKRVT